MVCNRFIPVTNVCMAYDEAHDRYSITSERTRFRQRDCRVSRVTCGTQNCCRVLVCPTQEIEIPKRMAILPFPLWCSGLGDPEIAHLWASAWPLYWEYGEEYPRVTLDPITGASAFGDFSEEGCGLEAAASDGSGLTIGQCWYTGIAPPTQSLDAYTAHIVDDPHVLIEFGYKHWFASAPGLKPMEMGGASGRAEPFSDTMSATVSNDPFENNLNVNGTFTLTWDRGAYYYFDDEILIGVKLGLTGANWMAIFGPNNTPGTYLSGIFSVSGNLTDEPFTCEWNTNGLTATMTEV